MSDETKGAGEIGPYWISYYVADEIMPAFEYHGPWWVSGTTMDGRTIICAAVMASDDRRRHSGLGRACRAVYRPSPRNTQGHTR